MGYDNLTIVNRHLQSKDVSLLSPTGSHYLFIAAQIDTSFLPFYLFDSKRKKGLISAIKGWCVKIKSEQSVCDAAVFKAIVVPPGNGKLLQERREKVSVARYDLAILVEMSSQQQLSNILNSSAYKMIIELIKNAAKQIYITTATNVRRINSVDHIKQGVFLFNYFYADDLQQNIDVWEYTAGWFQQETGLDNSTVLLPVHPGVSPYAIINHCRWDKLSDILPSLLFKKSFQRFVLENFYVNNVAAMPVLYKLA